MSGYLITEEADLTLDGIRYAARLSDGRGFAAFDGELSSDGQILTEVVPEDPDTWPDWAHPRHAVKRLIATGDERFILYGILIETGPEWRGPSDPVWDCTTTEYRDSRLGVPA
jgi:hypothetical protein